MPRPAKLSRDRIVTAAVAVADRSGLEGLSMRAVGAELGVEGMSLYHHVANKEALLDALAEWAVAQFALPAADAPWRFAMEQRARSMRDVLRRHPWAIGMLESRPIPGDGLLEHHDRVMAWMLGAGFSARLATHAFSTVDAFVIGFVVSERGLPFEQAPGAEAAFAADVAPDATRFPHLARGIRELFDGGDFSFADEFEAGLSLILDAVAERR